MSLESTTPKRHKSHLPPFPSPQFITCNPPRYAPPPQHPYNQSFYHSEPFLESRESRMQLEARKKHLRQIRDKARRDLVREALDSAADRMSPVKTSHPLIPNANSPLRKYNESYHHNLAPEAAYRLRKQENDHYRTYLKAGFIVDGRIKSQKGIINASQQTSGMELPARGMLTIG